MHKGGSRQTLEVGTIIRYAGLIIPIILISYGTLIAFEYVDSRNFAGVNALIVIAALWLTVGLYQFFSPGKTKQVIALRLTLYHLLSATYLLFVTGFTTPFAAAWIVFLIVAGTYFSVTGIWMSLAIFAVAIGFDAWLWYDVSESIILHNAVVFIAILFSGLVAMSIARSQEVDRNELDRSRAQESLQRERVMTIMNSLTDAVLSTDRTGVVRLYNAATLNLLDTNDNLEGHHIDEVLPLVAGDSAPVHASDILKNSKTITAREDLNYVFDDGEQIRLELIISPVRNTYRDDAPNKEEDGYIIIMRDITKAKSLEEERDEFISVVSHELRTPITIVEGSLSNIELMLQKPTELNKDSLLPTITSAHEQTLFLAKLVNDLSALSRAERGVADSKEVIGLKDLAHKLYDAYEKQAREKGLTFDLDLSAHLGSVIASRLYLEELLQNFITNSIKYTKEGSVVLSVKQRKGQVTFTVKDTGIGISKTDQAKIFDKFYRSEDYRTRETGGTGLGLYVATKLARKLGTEIELTSRLNHGSTFSFVLPIIKEEKTTN